ncbi:LysR family transcriptional regulator [Pseudovibrio sp. Tun.PSC04-5.I4]|uniref:LysR family transcriptional regulator n=1 Tax=Pseudovibrio sp. Tun.PSC04-5.I4 TaxID=1798213 RepID=UPI000884AA35|nr:LysR family transcriptional regulator [Pseudovibrio sp. Tun.PSC04-5.I4]SDR47489.1 DNA-binding transcriptional regulator, LysR family [Pseudovibrio sp. Tun.PSC04-5.I4]
MNYLGLDGRALMMLKLIFESGSVTKAAQQMNVNQSTVSHGLERVRGLLGDPLFVKAGRNVVPTERMIALMPSVEDVLRSLALISEPEEFHPTTATNRFVIDCQDDEHNLLVPSLIKRLRVEAPNVSLRCRHSTRQNVMSLVRGEADLLFTPLPPPDSYEFVAQALFEDEFVVFYDPTVREAPDTLEKYIIAPHANVLITDNENTFVDRALAELGHTRKTVYSAPSFNALAAVLLGTDLIATIPSKLICGGLKGGLASCKSPVSVVTADISVIWHVRNRTSAAHKWFRDLVISQAQALF